MMLKLGVRFVGDQLASCALPMSEQFLRVVCRTPSWLVYDRLHRYRKRALAQADLMPDVRRTIQNVVENRC
jgi:hypothetical protein